MNQNFNEQPKTPGKLSPQDLLKAYLSYQDAPLPPDVKAETLQYTVEDQSAKKYAMSLVDMSSTHTIQTLERAARAMTDECINTLHRLGIQPSPYGESVTWAMWDMSKQFYFFTHPGENDSNYSVGDPLIDQTKYEEIVDRHVGWEAFAAYNGNEERDFVGQIHNPEIRTQVTSYLDRTPKENGTLSSKELAELGALLRRTL